VSGPPPGAIRIPPVRDIEPDDFADGLIDIMNDWLVKNGHPPIEDDRPGAAGAPAEP
jgi:hypothetical protein